MDSQQADTVRNLMKIVDNKQKVDDKLDKIEFLVRDAPDSDAVFILNEIKRILYNTTSE